MTHSLHIYGAIFTRLGAWFLRRTVLEQASNLLFGSEVRALEVYLSFHACLISLWITVMPPASALIADWHFRLAVLILGLASIGRFAALAAGSLRARHALALISVLALCFISAMYFIVNPRSAAVIAYYALAVGNFVCAVRLGLRRRLQQAPNTDRNPTP